jgi:hypothetical protein
MPIARGSGGEDDRGHGGALLMWRLYVDLGNGIWKLTAEAPDRFTLERHALAFYAGRRPYRITWNDRLPMRWPK